MEIKLNVSEEVAKELLEKYGKKDWKPFRAKHNEYYWVMDHEGDFRELCELNTKSDDHIYLIGNYFQTREKAEQARLINLAKGRLNFRMLELNNGWTPNWKDNQEKKYSLYYARKDNEWKIDSYCHFQTLSDYHFSSKEIARQFIVEMKSDLDLVFNIK